MTFEQLYEHCEELVGWAFEDRTPIKYYKLHLNAAFRILQVLNSIKKRDERVLALLPIVLKHLSVHFKSEAARIMGFRLEQAYLSVSTKFANINLQ